MEAGESRWSKGRDGLRRTGPRQLSFAFADSPQGGGEAGTPDASGGRAFLLHTAKRKRTARTVASTADTSRLLEEVASVANLAQALLKVIRNKGAPGVDGQTVEEAQHNAAPLLAALRHALLTECYRPGDVRRVWLPKPGGGQRGLGIPNVVDRVVQQAVLQILEPIFEPTFHLSSHGFRPHRGAHTAIAQAKEHLEAGYRMVVDFDMSKFFDRVHHQRLLDRIAQRVSDRRLLALVRRMLKAGVVMPDGTKIAVTEGTPQGGPLSPLLSNIVLDELDWELERRGHRFVRYADDSNIFVRSARAGERVMASIRHFLERRMRLKVNEEKSGIRQPHQVHFLGALSRVPLSMPADRGGLANSRPAVGESGAAAENHGAGDDAPELGTIAHRLHEGTQPIPERMGGTLSAMHGGSHQGIAGSRCPHPPPSQGDHHPPEETTAFPVPALALPRRQHQGGRRGCVLRSRQMVLREPPGIDARLPAGLVLREAGIARHPMGRTQHQRTGVRAMAVAILTDRSKELDARPERPVL